MQLNPNKIAGTPGIKIKWIANIMYTHDSTFEQRLEI